MSVMVETLNLTKSFGPITAVDQLSFSVKRGEVLGFLGPNGAGKSTTMRIITAFMSPDSGTAKVCGHDVRENPMAVRQSLGYLPEAAPAYGEMSVEGFLSFVGAVRGMNGAALTKAIDRVVEMCNLSSVRGQSFETLSKGFKRRTCLAQALIHDPPVLILDEPTDGLDPNQKHEVRRLIADMASDKCIILSTHILEEVDAVCSRAMIIDNGRLISDCTPAELRSQSVRHGAVTVAFEGIDASAAASFLGALALAEKAKVTEVAGAPAVIVYPTGVKGLAAGITELAMDKGWKITELHVERGQLDEVFRTLTARGGE